MSVNGVTGSGNTYGAYTTSKAKNTETETSKEATTNNKTTDKPVKEGAVYKPSTDSKVDTAKKYKPDANVIARLKADSDARASQLKSLVEKMMSKQGETYGKANDMWKFLAGGNYTVDAATKSQAQADIADDGYWGVPQTSQRILDFATALTGGDPDKIEEMRSAFEKGYKQATKTWGGELPDISKKTYQAVFDGFDKLKANAAANVES